MQNQDNVAADKKHVAIHLPSSVVANSYELLIESICLNQLSLSYREYECYKLLIMDYRSKDIGKKLGISYRTVEKHIQKIKEKLQCHSIIGIMHLINRRIFAEIHT